MEVDHSIYCLAWAIDLATVLVLRCILRDLLRRHDMDDLFWRTCRSNGAVSSWQYFGRRFDNSSCAHFFRLVFVFRRLRDHMTRNMTRNNRFQHTMYFTRAWTSGYAYSGKRHCNCWPKYWVYPVSVSWGVGLSYSDNYID